MLGRSLTRTFNLLSVFVNRKTIYYLFLLPAIIPFVTFVLIPFLYTFSLTFRTGDLLKLGQFVGLNNYIRIIHDDTFRKAVVNTVQFVILIVPAELLLSLLLSLILSQRLRFGGTTQAILFIPWIIPITIIAVIWRFLLYPQQGIINYLIGLVGIPPQTWLASESLALPTLVVIEMWRGIGFFVMVWYAAIIEIPRDIYEYAILEGANTFQKLVRITLPLIRPTFIFLVIISIIWAFQLFDSVFVLTHGGPNKATFSAVYYIYRYTFHVGDVGLASTMSFALLGMVLLLTLIIRRLTKEQLQS